MVEIVYTEADAEFDSELVLTEVGNFTHITLIDSIVLNDERVSHWNNDLYEKVSEHAKRLRFLKFAREALSTERHNQYCYIENFQDAVLTGSLPAAALVPTEDRIHPPALVLNVRDIKGAEGMISDTSNSSLQAVMKQLKKDIERDRLLINGQRIVGAEAGLTDALAFLGQVCDNTLSECGLPALSSAVRTKFALSVLSKASRSQSGGIAFQAAQGLIDATKTILVPQSAVTPPLSIIIRVGSFPCPAAVTATTTIATDAAASNSSSSFPPPYASQDPEIFNNGLLMSPSVARATGATAGPGTGAGSQKWGLVCEVACETIFHIQDFDTPRVGDSSELPQERCTPARFVHAPHSTHAPPGFDTPSAIGTATAAATASVSPAPATATAPAAVSRDVPRSSDQAKQDSTTTTSARMSQTPLLVLSHNSYISVVYRDFVMFECKLLGASGLPAAGSGNPRGSDSAGGGNYSEPYTGAAGAAGTKHCRKRNMSRTQSPLHRVAPSGEMGNMDNLFDNWRATATVSMSNVVPVYAPSNEVTTAPAASTI